MKSTEHFKKVIEDYLNDRAENDKLFAEKYANEKKNIDDCITYILNEVQKSGYKELAAAKQKSDDTLSKLLQDYNILLARHIQLKRETNREIIGKL